MSGYCYDASLWYLMILRPWFATGSPTHYTDEKILAICSYIVVSPTLSLAH